MRRKNVDLPQPESAATPMITGGASNFAVAGTIGLMSSVHACVGYIVMPSTSLNLASASGEGQTKPVGTLLALACKAVSTRPARNCCLGARGETKETWPKR